MTTVKINDIQTKLLEKEMMERLARAIYNRPGVARDTKIKYRPMPGSCYQISVDHVGTCMVHVSPKDGLYTYSNGYPVGHWAHHNFRTVNLPTVAKALVAQIARTKVITP